jgi:hypothetical protein
MQETKTVDNILFLRLSNILNYSFPRGNLWLKRPQARAGIASTRGTHTTNGAMVDVVVVLFK